MISRKVDFVIPVLFGVLISGLFIANYALRDKMKNQKLYYDTKLADQVNCTDTWTEIDVAGKAEIIRDRQMIGLKFAHAFQINLENGQIYDADGFVIEPELKLEDLDGNKYQLEFFSARGNKIAHYRTQRPLDPEVSLRRLLLRCSSRTVEFSAVLWTSYNLRDMH